MIRLHEALALIVVLMTLLAQTSLGAEPPVQSDANATRDNGNTTREDGSSIATVVPQLEGIWKLTMGGTDATMAVHQFEGQLFGSASSEQESWNAAVIGSIAASSIDLTMIYLKSGRTVTVRLVGSYANESILGSYNVSDSSGGASNGDFSAMLIVPSTSGYTPVEEESQESAFISASSSEKVTATNAATSVNAADLTTSANATDSTDASSAETDTGTADKFVDVHSLAHLVPPAAGVIPPGINMGGGGGMGMG